MLKIRSFFAFEECLLTLHRKKRKKGKTMETIKKSKTMETHKVLGTHHNDTVENWYILIKDMHVNKRSLTAFVKQFRSENCKKNANIYMIDDASAYPLIREYPLAGEKYAKVARHFIALAIFDSGGVWLYPYLDRDEYPGEENDDVEGWLESYKVGKMVTFAKATKNKKLYSSLERKFGGIYYNKFRKTGDPIA
jgi:hypothetical protein